MSMRSKEVFVTDLKVKEAFEGIFMVKYIALMEGRDGKNYLNLVVADSSGEVECRLWNNKINEVSTEIKKGQFVLLKGKVNLYQGRKQVVIQTIDSVPSDEVDEKDFIVKSASSPEFMYEELLKIVGNLTDVYIGDLLKAILDDPEIKRRLLLWPAGKTIHHAYQSGLLEHILSCTELAVILSNHYQANPNYVVAGAILHDLAKIYELSDGFVVDYTEEGKLVGHLAKGLELIDRFSYRIKNFPFTTKMHLKHIVLSHHGSYEFGSPKVPQTSEALLVHLIDYLDSKMNSVLMVKRNDTNPGHWSSFVKHLDRIVFKGELPHFPEYVQPHQVREEGQEDKAPKVSKPPKVPKEIKENLGKHLQGFKIES